MSTTGRLKRGILAMAIASAVASIAAASITTARNAGRQNAYEQRVLAARTRVAQDPTAASAPAEVAPLTAPIAKAAATAAPVPLPAPRPAQPRPVPVVSTAQVAWDQPHTSWVDAPGAGISTSLGDYRDCTGNSDLGRYAAARDWCASSPVVYLVGHNPGAFASLTRLHTANLVRYWDPAGAATTYRIDHIDRVPFGATTSYMQDDSRPHLTLQTCATADASEVWELVAYPV